VYRTKEGEKGIRAAPTATWNEQTMTTALSQAKV